MGRQTAKGRHQQQSFLPLRSSQEMLPEEYMTRRSFNRLCYGNEIISFFFFLQSYIYNRKRKNKLYSRGRLKDWHPFSYGKVSVLFYSRLTSLPFGMILVMAVEKKRYLFLPVEKGRAYGPGEKHPCPTAINIRARMLFLHFIRPRGPEF